MVQYNRPGEKIEITHTDKNGRQRHAVATNRSGQPHHWDTVVTNPSGQTWTGQVSHGNKDDALAGLQQMLANTENAFIRDAERGDARPVQAQTGPRDRIVSAPYIPIIPTGR